jgi:hypothetical protein
MMIAGSKFVTVSNSYTNWPTFYMNTNNPMIGMIRRNSNTGTQEVFDGNNWIAVYEPQPTITLSTEAEQAMAWAANKMAQENNINKLAEEYPAIKDMLAQQKDLSDKLEMLMTLVKQEKKV